MGRRGVFPASASRPPGGLEAETGLGNGVSWRFPLTSAAGGAGSAGQPARRYPPCGSRSMRPSRVSVWGGGGDGCRPGDGPLSDLLVRGRRFGFGGGLDDALLSGLPFGRGVVGHRVPKPQGGPFAVIGELDLHIVEAGGGAMLDGPFAGSRHRFAWSAVRRNSRAVSRPPARLLAAIAPASSHGLAGAASASPRSSRAVHAARSAIECGPPAGSTPGQGAPGRRGPGDGSPLRVYRPSILSLACVRPEPGSLV